MLIGLRGKACPGIGMRIGERQIGLYVDNRRSVHKVCSLNPYRRAVGGVGLNLQDAHRRKTDVVRAER